MNKTEILKHEIMKQYRNVRQFSIEMSIPYSTLITALDRGIEGMAYDTVIRMCEKLSLNPVDLSSLGKDDTLGDKIIENKVMTQYLKLNRTGRRKIMDLMEDLSELEKYQVEAVES